MSHARRSSARSQNRIRKAADYALEQLERRQLLSAAPDIAMLLTMGPQLINTGANLAGGAGALVATQVPGPLAGHVLYTSGGHGFYWNGSSWGVMRSYVNNMMEDMNNQDQLEPYADYALAAGATFVSMRPIGHQVNEVLVDNSDTYSASTGGFQTLTGTWTSNTSSNAYWSNNNGNDAVHYLTATTATSESATARFTPKITAAGFYPVYAWWDPASVSSKAPADDMLYRVNYSGGSAEVHVAADKVGDGWVYLGNYYFDAGVNPTSGSVDISNQSATANKIAVADAIRLGNGMGDVNYSYTYPNGTGNAPVMVTMPISGQPRENEAALYWCYAERGWTGSGTRVAPSTVYNGSIVDDMSKNFDACDIYATYMNQGNVGSMTDRLWISFHSNASNGNGVTRGTLGLINSSPTPNQAALALLAGQTVQNEMAALDGTYENPWVVSSNPTFSGGYSEISQNVIGGEFDATIIEVAYHDQSQDATDLKDPKVRQDVGRATLHTAIKYFQTYGGLANVTYAPEPPTDIRATTDTGGNVILNWATGPSSSGTTGPYGNAATGYRIYTSTNGYGFSLVGTTTGTTFTLAGLPTTSTTYFRITAINGGGESLASVVAAAKPRSGATAQVLIVNNFTRLDASQDQTETYFFGTISRAREEFNNSFNYVVQAGNAIAAYGNSVGFDTVSTSALDSGEVSLASYKAVIWMSGDQSTVDHTFTTSEQTLVNTYLTGGKMFVSGSEIGWDLDAQNHGASFYNNSLKADYVADDANTYATTGVAGSIFAGLSLNFDDGTHGTYNVAFPDVLNTFGGSTAAMTYSGGTGGNAAIAYNNAATGMQVVNMGFPFETITTAANRNAVMADVLTYFGLNVVSASISGRIYIDANGNSTFDGTDVGRVGDVAYLDLNNNGALDSGEPSAATDPNGSGNFTFASVAPGTYTLRYQTAGSGTFVQTVPAVGNSYSITISGGSGAGGQDFALFPTSFTGSSGNDNYYVRLDPTGANLEISLSASPLSPATYSIAKAKVTALSFDGAGGDDTFTIDYSNGQPTSGNITVTGGPNGGSGDLLHIIGSSVVDTIGVAPGTISFSNATVTSNVSYTGIEAIQVDGAGSGDTFNYSSVPTPVAFNGGTSILNVDTLNINSGTYAFNADAMLTTPNMSLNVASGAAAIFNTTQHLYNLSVSGAASLAAGGNKVLVTRTLSVAGTLDLADNKAIVNYNTVSPLAATFDLLASGRNGGAWNGLGIQSSLAGSSGRKGLGLAEASDVLGLSGTQTGAWAGETVDSGALLIRYTYVGDLNLDGRIDGDDYFRIDQNYPVNTFGYAAGDIDYSRTIDADDYFRIDSNYAAGQTPLA